MYVQLLGTPWKQGGHTIVLIYQTNCTLHVKFVLSAAVVPNAALHAQLLRGFHATAQGLQKYGLPTSWRPHQERDATLHQCSALLSLDLCPQQIFCSFQ